MDAFTQATTWHYQAFLGTGNGDIWRLWFDGDHPLIQLMTGADMREYREALNGLGIEQNVCGYGVFWEEKGQHCSVLKSTEREALEFAANLGIRGSIEKIYRHPPS
jgi:hypothetical protein